MTYVTSIKVTTDVSPYLLANRVEETGQRVTRFTVSLISFSVTFYSFDLPCVEKNRVTTLKWGNFRSLRT